MTANMKKAKRRGSAAAVIFSLILFVSVLCYTSAKWYVDSYGKIGFDSVLYTLMSNLGGVEKGLIFNYIKDGLLYAAVLAAVIGLALFFPFRKRLVLTLLGKKKMGLYPLPKAVSCLICVLLSGLFLLQAAQDVELEKFIDSMRNPSTFFQDHYVAPDDVQIRFPEEKRNLIYIYLESVETTFFSEEEGGALEENVIKELYRMAQENVNFSHNEDVGGFVCTPGTTWTIGAMVGHTTGVPLKALAGQAENEMSEDGAILPGITALSDILKKNGYYQCLMIGSEAAFGDRKCYFEGHGIDKIYDYWTAVEDRIIPQDYYVWWGMEDEYLFEYAKQELQKISEKEEPFAFSMLTVDTHRTGGYVCDLCESEFSEQYENVNACSSRQVYAFVEWLKQQDFYENTTIVIAGDHLSMDGVYISENVPQDYTRHGYNCFVHSAVTAENTKNRRFCSLDLFPTTLAAMGCEIEGDRLGLGTNLFSDMPTLIEEMGLEAFEAGTSAFSSYYMDQFENYSP